MIDSARSEALQLDPNWSGNPPLSICLHDPAAQKDDLMLCDSRSLAYPGNRLSHSYVARVNPGNEARSLRLIYLHMIEEYARHIGHADFLREQIDGATGE